MSKKISDVEAAPGLDLTPIMNMVLCLIPLMLLSVVFMTISVIDVSMPQRSAGAAASDGEPPQRLQLFISKQGFTIVEGVKSLPAIEGCPNDGPTICLKDENESTEVKKYNWLQLYNTLFGIKTQKGEWSDHDQIDIVADSAVNYGVLVKAMDISRYQLTARGEAEATKGKSFTSEEGLNDALAVTIEDKDNPGKKKNLDLFPVVVLGLPTMGQ